MDQDALNELARLEDSLLRLCPTRQWELVTVTFPATANTDLDIAHTLGIQDPDLVDYLVVQAAQPCQVWHDTSATRTPWASGLLRLRCTVPTAKVVILLTVSDRTGRAILNPGSTGNTYFPWTASPLGVSVGTIGSTTSTDLSVGPGVTFGTQWAVGYVDNGTDKRLVVYDMVQNLIPFMFRWQSGVGWSLQPGPASNAGNTIQLGNGGDSFSGGYWDALYTSAILSPGFATPWGQWAPVTFSAGNFTASAGTWTVASGDVNVNRAMVVDHTLFWKLDLTTTSVSNAGVSLRATLPGGFTAAVTNMPQLIRVDDAGGGAAVGVALTGAGVSYVEFRATNAGGAFGIATNTTLVQASLVIEVQ